MNDFRLAWRNAVRRPGFTLLVTLTLALGLGVNAAVFALVDAVLLQPLPYRDPARLVFLWQTLPQQNMFEVEATPYDYTAWQALRSMSSLAMVTYESFTLTGDGEPERVRGARMTASMMPTLGIGPALGRGFTEAENLDDAPAVAILSDALWRRRYGGDPAIVGRSIEIDGTPRTVVGVMPRTATLPGAPPEDNQLWLPMRMSPSERASEISHNYAFVGRLADGVTVAAASTEIEALASRLSAERPSHTRIGARVTPVSERAVRTVRPALLVGTASVALLLLVAAANAATLLVARAANRRHELAVRAALGATRMRLLAMSLAEGIVYAAVSAVAGLVLGQWTLRWLVPLFADSLPAALAIGIGARAALVTAGLSIAAGIALEAVPSLAQRSAAVESMSGHSRSTASRSAARTRTALVAGQVALAVVLLSTAGLLVNTLVRLSHVHPGFAADRVLTFRLALLGPRYAAPDARVAFVSDLLDRLDAAPGVRSAAASAIPFGGTRNATVVEIEGREEQRGSRAIIDQRHVSAGYFRTMQIPLVSGRLLTSEDGGRSEPVTLINRTMAKRYFANESPLNRRVRISAGADAGTWFRIVGVVEDVRHIALNRDPVAEMYRPITQTAASGMTVVVKTTADPAALAASARAIVHAVDRDLPIYDVRSMEDRVAATMSQTRTAMLLLLVTAILAASLAAVAIYGSVWFAVVQRTSEIGIRIALGASRLSIFGEVIASAVATAAIGAGCGLAISAAAGSLLQSMLFDTGTADPATFVAVIGAVLALAVCASVVPAIRATRIDPLAALRSE